MNAWLRWTVLLALFGAVALQALRAARILEASRIVRAVEVTSPQFAQAGARSASLLRLNLEQIRRAEVLDRTEVRIPQAKGSLYYLLASPEPAIAAYREALAIQPGAEIFMNLGLAHRAAQQPEEARPFFAQAVALDPDLRGQVPAGGL